MDDTAAGALAAGNGLLTRLLTCCGFIFFLLVRPVFPKGSYMQFPFFSFDISFTHGD